VKRKEQLCKEHKFMNEAEFTEQPQYLELVAERDALRQEVKEIKDRYLRSLMASHRSRGHLLLTYDGPPMMRSGDELPEKFWKVLRQIVAHPLCVRAVRIALHPDRVQVPQECFGTDYGDQERRMREQMVRRFTEFIDYVRQHSSDED
jgi:hypothetical protein